VDLFPNSQLGAETDYIKGLQDGTIQINWVTSSVFTTTIPELLLFNLPYVYKSAETVHKAINGPAKQAQEQKLAAAGIKVLSWGSYGFRQVGGKEAYEQPDMHGAKIRTVASPLFTAMFQLFNAVPTALNASDVYSALQQNVVSGYDITLSNLVGFKWYEQANKITRTFHSNAVFFVGMNRQIWDGLPKEVQNGVAEAAAQATEQNDNLQLAQEAQAVSDLQAKGATVLTPDLKPWRDKVTPKIWPQFASQVGGMSVIDKLVNSQ
jgi:tripartite ATP-independent transporter DctP family solute receptor